MSLTLLQTAAVLPKLPRLAWASARRPGPTLTTPNPAGGSQLIGGVEVLDGGVDLAGYAYRDSELQWRDLAVAAALELLARRAATVFGAPVPYVTGYADMPVTTLWEASSTVALVEQVTEVLVAVPTATINVSAYPLRPGSVRVSVRLQGETEVLSSAVDDTAGLLPDQSSTVPAADSAGTIRAGWVNYERGLIYVEVKPHATSVLEIVTSAEITPIFPAVSVPAGATGASWLLTQVPVARNSVVLTLGDATFKDDGRGRWQAHTDILSGSIDYVTGSLTVVLKPHGVPRSGTCQYRQVRYLEQAAADLDAGQAASALGGDVGIRYALPSDVPTAAATTDKHLYRRDLVLYEVLKLADAIFQQVSESGGLSAEPTLAQALSAGTAITQAWSQAEAASTPAQVQFGVYWGPHVFAEPDKYLAWRDNVVAWYVSEVSRLLQSDQERFAALACLVTETGRPLLVEDGTANVNSQVPESLPYASQWSVLAVGTGEQTGTAATVAGFSLLTLGARPGDRLVWLDNMAVELGTVVISEVTGASTAVVFPPVSIPAASIVQLHRDLVITWPPPRALMPERDRWQVTLRGAFEPLEWAQRVYLRVTDSQEVDSEVPTVLAALGDYGLATIDPEGPHDQVAALVHTWNPSAVLFLGDNNYYHGRSADIAENNRGYTDYVAAGICYPTMGNHDFSWQTGDPGDPGLETDDTSTNTGYDTQLDFFNPPGWETPERLDGNNGRYYRQVVGPHVEIFCLNPGWNGSYKSAALNAGSLYDGSDPGVTLEPGGWWPGCDQWLWLQAALADSKATWKIVFFHFPPYTSHNTGAGHPGYRPCRLPFKEWGAHLVLTADVHAYERLEIGGLTYVVCGVGGSTTRQYQAPYSVGSKVRHAEGEITRFGALRLTATSRRLRGEMITVANSDDRRVVDQFTLLADLTRQVPSVDPLRLVTVATGPSGYQSRQVLKVGSIEYSAPEGSAVCTLQAVAQDSALYSLARESNQYRVFESNPKAPGVSQTLIYDRRQRSLRLVTPAASVFTLPQEAAPQLVGIRASQRLEIVPTAPAGNDLEYWRQQAARVLRGRVREHPLWLRGSTHALDLTTVAYLPAGWPAGVASSPYVGFVAPGSQSYNNFELPILRTDLDQWFQFNLLVEPVVDFYWHGSAWAPSYALGDVTAGVAGLNLPPANANNVQQRADNVPRAAWQVQLPLGVYQLKVDWVDLNAAPTAQVTVRVDQKICYTGTWRPLTATSQLFDAGLIKATGEPQLVSLSVNGPVTPTGFQVRRLVFSRVGSAAAETYELRLTLTDAAGDSTFAPVQRLRGVLSPGTKAVLRTEWIHLRYFGNLQSVNFQLQLVTQPAAPLLVRAVDCRTRLAVETYSESSQYRAQLLRYGLVQLASRLTVYDGPVDAGTWTAELAQEWYQRLSQADSRLMLALRPGWPGDLGQPALVPRSLRLAENGSAAVVAGPLGVTLTPWTPVLGQLGFLVAREDFWVVDRPLGSLQLRLIDQRGEDFLPADPFAPSLDFTKSVNSQYLPLI